MWTLCRRHDGMRFWVYLENHLDAAKMTALGCRFPKLTQDQYLEALAESGMRDVVLGMASA